MLAAILFDLDGTLANTDPIHFLTWQELLREYGLEIDETFYKKRISGRLNPDIVQDILPQLSVEEGQRVADEKEATFRKLATELKPLDGLSELLVWAKEQGLKRSLVTNAPRENVDCLLEVLGLGDSFAPVVLAEEEGVAGKPDPAPYQVALSHLGIAPEQAIAFEDSPSGIRSAVAAGIQTVGIASTHDPNILTDVGAAIAIADFSHSLLWDLLPSLVSN